MIEQLQRLLRQFFDEPSSRDRRWVRISLPRETWRFGGAAPSDFGTFLAMPSSVAVTSIEQACTWLRECRYEHDEVQFGVPDRWQPPAEFETHRRGDCEDHALWVWRKLHDLGYQAELVVGRWFAAAGAETYHAWVVYSDRDGRRMLLEAVTKDPDRMSRPLADVYDEYLPFHSIDGMLQTYTYGGYLLALERGDPAAR